MHPLFGLGVRLKLRSALRVKGYRFGQINDIVEGATDETIRAAMLTGDVAVPDFGGTTEGVGALGDGSILKAIMDFLSSPTGQALIAALLKLLLGA